jgi:hypothetical protein
VNSLNCKEAVNNNPIVSETALKKKKGMTTDSHEVHERKRAHIKAVWLSGGKEERQFRIDRKISSNSASGLCDKKVRGMNEFDY